MRNPPLLPERARPPRTGGHARRLSKKCVWCSRYEPGTPSENTANTPLGGGVSPRTGSSRGEGDRRGGGYRRGLCGALAARARGLRARRPLGVGINLMPHAVRELTELGLGGELEATGIPTAEMVHFDRHGNRIWGFASGRNIGSRCQQYSILRGDLQMILLVAVRERLGPGAVRTGTAFVSFAESPAGVLVRVRDRSSGPLSALRGDVLVGADGLSSQVRAQLHPGEPPPRWGGVMMWRGMAEGAPFLTGRTVAVAGTNAAVKVVAHH